MTRVVRLSAEHRTAEFHSGSKPLDNWLASHALENDRRNLSRTFLLLDDGDRVAGYYSLTMGSVRREALPTRLGRGLPMATIGMVLLGRLAVDQRHQGKGVGRDLLIDAVEQAALAGEHAAARFIAVDPIDDQARLFYSHFGFCAIGEDEGGRMFVRIDSARASLARRAH